MRKLTDNERELSSFLCDLLSRWPSQEEYAHELIKKVIKEVSGAAYMASIVQELGELSERDKKEVEGDFEKWFNNYMK